MSRQSRPPKEFFLILTLLVPLGPCWAQSEPHPLLSSSFSVDAGMFFPQSDFALTVGASVDIGSVGSIDFEKTFDTTVNEDIASLQFTWRFGEKWSLWGQYIDFDDSVAAAVLEEDVVWGDVTFGAGTGVAAGMGTTITRVYFGRDFLQRDDKEFGLGFGAHIIDIEAFIAGQAIINGVPVGARKETAKTSGILPNIGAWYIHELSPRWAFKTRLDWLGAKVGKYDGQFVNFALGVNFQVFKHVGVGLNYNWIEADLEVDDPPWRGEVLSRAEGLFAYVSAYW